MAFRLDPISLAMSKKIYSYQELGGLKTGKTKTEFLVQWDDKVASWEPEEFILNPAERHHLRFAIAEGLRKDRDSRLKYRNIVKECISQYSPIFGYKRARMLGVQQAELYSDREDQRVVIKYGPTTV